MQIYYQPIGFIKTDAKEIPRHWTVSDVEGSIIIDERYQKGLRDINVGQDIVVIFHFHKSPEFRKEYLIQKPPHTNKETGVFSTCSPIRPNPIGLSVLKVTDIKGNVIHVKGIDMLDGTPVLDIKPFVKPSSDSK
jgi:tRNA-Thr(GGU) m(6)t(6)A37 methyltransferase TsaA